MNTYKSSAQLKALAREQLIGKFSSVIGALVLYLLINLALSTLTNMLTDNRTIFGYLIGLLINFFCSFFIGIFSVGFAFIYLNLSCNRPFKASDVFFGFSHQPDKALLLLLVTNGISWIAMLPSYIFSYIYTHTLEYLMILPLCLAFIIGEVIIVYVSICFSQIFYLILDFPGYSAKQILSLSNKIMKGHKGRLFYIEVSFLPLILLSLLSCGIGLLWVIPYMQATLANFYLDVMRNRQV